eukprot:9474140-Pyramimonas_sp.AAC.1
MSGMGYVERMYAPYELATAKSANAFALDSRARSTIKSSGLLETWTEGLGSEVRGAVDVAVLAFNMP